MYIYDGFDARKLSLSDLAQSNYQYMNQVLINIQSMPQINTVDRLVIDAWAERSSALEGKLYLFCTSCIIYIQGIPKINTVNRQVIDTLSVEEYTVLSCCTWICKI